MKLRKYDVDFREGSENVGSHSRSILLTKKDYLAVAPWCFSKMSSSSVVPLVLWGSTPPSHTISCVISTYDQKTIVSGSHDGQLIIWDLRFSEDGAIKVSACVSFCFDPYMKFLIDKSLPMAYKGLKYRIPVHLVCI